MTPTLARPAPLCPSDQRVGPTHAARQDDDREFNYPQPLQGPKTVISVSPPADWTVNSRPGTEETEMETLDSPPIEGES